MSHHRRADHAAVALRCRTLPGQWQNVGEYNSSQSASGMCGHIRAASTNRSGGEQPYAPPGAFEARRRLTEYGARVEARYTGDQTWADAVAALDGGAA